MGMSTTLLLLVLFFLGLEIMGLCPLQPQLLEAPVKFILFFQCQRSLPDLTGGYYDAGDNVKFNSPIAYTTTMLSWGVLEYGTRMGSDLSNARTAIRWATDYLLKCATATPGKLYVGVGDPNADHHCCERPEDMDTVRSVYSVSAANPGSDVAGETAAALAAASLVFRKADPKYSALLLSTARKVMQFAIQYRGAYGDSLGPAVCPFYCSYSGYKVNKSYPKTSSPSRTLLNKGSYTSKRCSLSISHSHLLREHCWTSTSCTPTSVGPLTRSVSAHELD
ncbi:hypothetical protein SAY87_028804 [Trapa incisa]|uniref:cellulase n=1 Tax=Trapa incisa TaxID=236973 RepID=A0AAN7L2H7_9MYRT|nr:hypothetical protein SAY87_028804 [Trapa incisa]